MTPAATLARGATAGHRSPGLAGAPAGKPATGAVLHTAVHDLPATRVCEQARLSRDPRFDGLFFTAVASTGIYCRPVCPAPVPRRENVRYFGHAAAAEAAGYRPCLRCRPELSPEAGSWRRGDATVARALKLIDAGALNEQPLAALARRVGIGERQLRRLFVERLGAPPSGVHGTRRLLFAKQLLTETGLPVTQVAMAAGFGSLRRFNATFKEAYRMAPRELRRRPRAAEGEALVLRLGYRPPYDLVAMLDFLRGRALPGVDAVGTDDYVRVLDAGWAAIGAAGGDRRDLGIEQPTGGSARKAAVPLPEGRSHNPATRGLGRPDEGAAAQFPAWLRVSAWPGGEHALRLELHGVPPHGLLDVVGRVRRVFDLDADPLAIAAPLSTSPLLRPLLQRRPGLRLPGGWDGFEIAVRAILGQQVSVAAARTLATRLAQRHGRGLASPPAPGLTHLFPTPAALADADLETLGILPARAATLRGMARALLDGDVDFRAEQTLDGFVARWTALPGIGPWTAHYIAMRALGHPDAFPADDLVLRRMAGAPGHPATARALGAMADAWRPWRAYAVIHLWREAMASPPARTPPTLPRTRQ